MRGFAFACAAVVAVALPSASVVRAQSLGLTMSVSRPQTVLAGGTFSETVTVTNPGTSATGTVNVELAGGGNEQWCETSPASGCAGLTGGAAIFPIGSIASGASATAQFDVKTTADLGNGMADGTVRAGDGNVFALTDSHWVLKLDPNAQPTDVTAQFVSNSTPFDPQYNGETVWRVTNRGDGPARGIVFEFHITPSPYELYDHGDIFGGTPTLLPYPQPGP